MWRRKDISALRPNQQLSWSAIVSDLCIQKTEMLPRPHSDLHCATMSLPVFVKCKASNKNNFEIWSQPLEVLSSKAINYCNWTSTKIDIHSGNPGVWNYFHIWSSAGGACLVRILRHRNSHSISTNFAFTERNYSSTVYHASENNFGSSWIK